MNQLAKQGVYAAPSETKAFLLDGNINHLKTYPAILRFQNLFNL